MRNIANHKGLWAALGLTGLALFVIAGAGGSDEPGFIDPSITGDDRDLLIAYMWDLEPYERENVVVFKDDGSILANRIDLAEGWTTYMYDEQSEAYLDALGNEYVVPAGSISRIQLGFPEDPDSGVIGGGSGGSTSGSTGTTTGSTTGSTTGTGGETGGETTGGTTSTGGETTGGATSGGETGGTTGGATSGGSTGGGPEPDPEEECRCEIGEYAVDNTIAPHKKSGPYRRIRTRADLGISSLSGYVHLPARNPSLDIEDRNIAPPNKLKRGTLPAGGHRFEDNPCIYFGAGANNQLSLIDVGLQFNGGNDPISSDAYAPFAHHNKRYAHSYSGDEGSSAGNYKFEPGKKIHMSIKTHNQPGSGTKPGVHCVISGPQKGTLQTITVTIIVEASAIFTANGQGVTLARVVSIAQADKQLAPKSSIDAPNAGTWFCGVEFSSWRVKVGNQDGLVLGHNHVASISNYPRANKNGSSIVIEPNDSIWTAPMIRSNRSPLSTWSPANEIVSIDLRSFTGTNP